ncbi:hypothetical protein BB558_002742 [Smittium angustum]|uniref:Major facilitator superfamily (MFS) profile domain-containing protein n=1 Tax=Smittium angustum TaxID=133377 RepID=A0A2U1J7T3_SMIAN|nr:hypothetical protein BB558_002742 [Smittium angustum]
MSKTESTSYTETQNDRVSEEVDLSSEIVVHTEETDETPPDKGYAWVILLAGVMNYMMPFGSINAFGVFQTYYLLTMFPNEPARHISWISTMALSCSYLCGIFASSLIARFGLRGTNLIGTLVGAGGLLLASFCTKIWQLVLTQGVIFGIGSSIIVNVSVVVPSLWFEKHIGIAIGAIISGSGLGSLVITPITTQALKALGIPWTFRILSLMFLVFTGFGSIVFKPRRHFVSAKSVINLKHLKDPVALLLCFSGFFMLIGYTSILLYFPASIVALGETKQLSSNLIMVFSAFSMAGRILSGQLARRLGSIKILIVNHAVTGIVMILLWNLGKSLPAYIVAFALIGLFSVPLFTLSSVIIANHYPKKYISQVNGLVSLFMGTAAIVGIPLIGLVFDVVGKRTDFKWVKIIGAICFFITIIFFVLLRSVLLKSDPKYRLSPL